MAPIGIIDPKRHQGYVQEWVVGYRTQLPGAAQQFVTGGNQINSTNYGQMQNVQTPRAAQLSARWRF